MKAYIFKKLLQLLKGYQTQNEQRFK